MATDAAPKRVVVTRPRPAGEQFAALLSQRGYVPLLDPASAIEPLAHEPPPAGALDGVILTSANGLLGAEPLPRDLPVHAVGAASASAARDRGFSRVHEAGGSARALADDLAKSLPGGVFLWLRGEDARESALRALPVRFSLIERVVYRAVEAGPLAPAVARGLEEGSIRAVTFFSARAAERWLARVDAAGRTDDLARVFAVFFSSRIAETAAAARWAGCATATARSAAAMVDQLDGALR